MKLLLMALIISLPFTALTQAPPSEDVPVKQAGSYKVGSDTWKVLIIPPGVSKERLVRMAKTLHDADPSIRYHIFDDDEDVTKFLMSKRGLAPFPEKWFNKHHVGSLQTMAFDRSGPQWTLLVRNSVQVASLEVIPIHPSPIRPTAASAKEAVPGQVIVEYNQLENLTTVRLKVMTIGSFAGTDINLSALFAYTGRIAPRQNPFTLQFVCVSSGWRFSDGADVTLTVDDVPMPLGHWKRDLADGSSGVAFESVSGLLPYRSFLKLAWAKSARGQVGNYYFTLKPEQITSLRDLASRMSP